MKLVYVAGPFRAENGWEVERNIRTAEEIAYRLYGMGVSVICPHSNGRYFDGTFTDQFWLDATAEMLRRCDMLVLTNPDAPQKSEGTRQEVEIARDLGIPVMYFIEDCLIEYIR